MYTHTSKVAVGSVQDISTTANDLKPAGVWEVDLLESLPEILAISFCDLVRLPRGVARSQLYPNSHSHVLSLYLSSRAIGFDLLQCDCSFLDPT